MTPAQLEIRLFGPLSVAVHGTPISRWRTRSVSRLLALLTLRQGHAVERSWLAGSLWPESSESGALRNLRDDLMHLRRALGAEAERIQSPSRDRLRFAADGAAIDVVDFDRWIIADDEPTLARAVAAYRGPLLEGCLEEWAVPERERRAAECLTALERLAVSAEGRGDWSAALELLRKAETLDPLRDSLQRGLLRVLAAGGDLPEATHGYREFRLRLHRELNTEPDPETTRLFEQIRRSVREPSRPAPAPLPGREPESVIPFVLPAAAALPHPLTHLIGRDEELDAVLEMLRASRLVTIVGGGGLGKTRLAIEAGRRLQLHTVHGTAFVPLANLSDPSLPAAYVAELLGVDRKETAVSPGAALAARLRQAELLLVLDNCEHLVDEAATLAQALLEQCPQLRILATSRQRLGIVGEVVWRIPSLAVPEEPAPDGPAPTAEALARYPAARLLVERLELVKPGFRIRRAEEAHAVAQICRRLDGIPLALELAAARATHLSVVEIASRLDDRFRLLTGGNRGVLPRHRTLRLLVDWSYALLDPGQQTLLHRLAVFSGGWTLEAAEAVCAGWSGLEAEDVLDLLTGLGEQSLVQTEEQGGTVRYFWLETLREYALERLRAGGEEAEARRRHRDYFLTVAEAGAAAISGREQTHGLEALRREHDNLRAALTYSQDDAEGAVPALRLAASLWRYWTLRGHYAEGSEHLRAALARDLPSANPQALNARAASLLAAGIMALDQGALEEAERLISEGRELCRQLGNARGSERACTGLGHIAIQRDRPQEARRFYLQSLEFSRSRGDRWAEASTLGNLGAAALAEGDYEQAAGHYREARVLAHQVGNLSLAGALTTYLGLACLEAGRTDEAETLQRAALEILHPIDAARFLVEVIELAAGISSARGDLTRGLHLYGASETLRRERRLSPRAVRPHRKEQDLTGARERLGVAVFEAVLAEGRTLPLDRLFPPGSG